jgi:alkanesulfonate monooxygenase SsuD/methylene tetrahydromethanopterin reductase-like flavin-dependent oxidoreductase (luciferase family)
MKFLLITLITHVPDPVSGEKKSPADRLRDVLDKAVLAEELGFDGFAVGERHEDPFISSSPPVVLSNIAARTSRIALFTGVTTLIRSAHSRTTRRWTTCPVGGSS